MIGARFTTVVLACMFTAACTANTAADDEGTTESVSQPIIGGSAATAYPEAILVDLYQGGQLFGYCSGSVIAPQVVLTAGHCVDGFTSWKITAPNASNQKATATSGTTYDWAENGAETVNPNHHDLGLIFLSSPINLTSYPVLATTALTNGASIVNIGRINNGTLSTTNLYVSKPTPVTAGASSGFPYDYSAAEIIQSGDSGGPDEIPGSSPHKIAAVNSGAGGSSEVLARVDLLETWIAGQIASHGGSGSSGSGSSGGSGGSSATDAGTGGDAGGTGSGSGSGGTGSGGSGGGSTGTCTGGGADYQHPVALGASACGSLVAGGQDWFSYSIGATGVAYDLELSPSGDAQVELWKQTSAGYSQVANTSGTSVAHSSSSAGTYVLVVYSPSSAAQSYTVKLTK